MDPSWQNPSWPTIPTDGDLSGLTERPYLVKGVLGPSELAALYGFPGAGKSFLALHLAVCIASGEPWFGRRTKKVGVVYIAAEGASGFELRCAALAKVFGPLPSALKVVNARPNLGAEVPETDALIQHIKYLQSQMDCPVGLVIIDTLAQTIPGQDENQSGTMTGLVAQAEKVRRLVDATVLLVHHAGKNGDRGLRGHSSLLAALDTVIVVRRSKQDGSAAWALEKRKDGPEDASRSFQLATVELCVDAEGDPLTSCVVVEGGSSPALGNVPRSKGASQYDELIERTVNAYRSDGYDEVGRSEFEEHALATASEAFPQARPETLKKGVSRRIRAAVEQGSLVVSGEMFRLVASPDP